MIVLEQVGKRYKNATVGPVTFTVRPKEVVALVGPNGSGKSSVIYRMLELRRGTGATSFGGYNVPNLAKKYVNIGVVFDSFRGHENRSVVGHLRLAAIATGQTRSQCNEILTEISLSHVRKQKIGTLSLGMKQRLVLGCALIGEPNFFLMDEPTTGLDTAAQSWLSDMLNKRAATGAAILVSTHDSELIKSTADRVIRLIAGQMSLDTYP